ncbi:hypothetical protein VNN28_10080 (plasmid) [Lactococcus formosensis]|uniref:hypothetical protein n=1 Tax=Lactococcus formosensis TaxID=1281486 RepID=UPI0030CBBB53
MNQELNIAYIFSCIMDNENNLSMTSAGKKIKSFLKKSQDNIDKTEREEWVKVENELIEMDLDTFENWKKIAVSTFRNKQNNN